MVGTDTSPETALEYSVEKKRKISRQKKFYILKEKRFSRNNKKIFENLLDFYDIIQ